MSNLGRWAFIVGIVLAVVAAFFPNNWLPWIVGGLGILVGLLNVTAAEVKPFLLAGIGLVVALTAILAQHYNPAWLNDVVFYARVFVAHVLLIVALLAVFRTAGS